MEAIKEAGAIGTLVNHSERRLRLDEIRWIVEKARTLGLETIVCAATAEESAAVAMFKPSAVAVEPPELIGTGRAVSREKPEVITRSVELVRKVAPDVPVLCGAGVESGEDVKRALELGAQGVLVASAIVKARDWVEKIREMAEAMLREN
jgi:triosephosphate isomerase